MHHPLEGSHTAAAAHARHLLANKHARHNCYHTALRVQHAGEGGDRENAPVLKLALELVGETRDSRVVGGVSPLAPLLDALIVRRVPIAIQLPVDVLEALVDEVCAVKKPNSGTQRICITSS